MRNRRIVMAFAAHMAMGGLVLYAGGQSGGAGQAPAAPAKNAEGTAEASLALGKKKFVERCASCHDENGTKPVGGGLPLSERKLSDEALAKSVRGRLKSSPENEQRAVAAYIRSFQKK